MQQNIVPRAWTLIPRSGIPEVLQVYRAKDVFDQI